jgi:L-lactate dehydrogenase
MKIGIVGTGMVGSTAAYALIMRGIGRELVVVDVNKQRAQAEADDLLHAVPFSYPLRVRAGDYADLSGSEVVLISAGVAQRPSETRLQLLKRNQDIFQQIIPQILSHAPEAILLVASNPVDVMTHLTARIAAEFSVPSSRVIGSGTTLDTARFRALLGKRLGIDSHQIHAYVLGEHGDSEVLTWSIVTVAGVPLDDFCMMRDLSVCSEERDEIDYQVRHAAYKIIEGKGATYYGVGSALARIVEVIWRDQRAILTVCTPAPDIEGVPHVTVSLPHMIGDQGVLDTFHPILDEKEKEALRGSAQLIHDAIESLDRETTANR